MHCPGLLESVMPTPMHCMWNTWSRLRNRSYQVSSGGLGCGWEVMPTPYCTACGMPKIANTCLANSLSCYTLPCPTACLVNGLPCPAQCLPFPSALSIPCLALALRCLVLPCPANALSCPVLPCPALRCNGLNTSAGALLCQCVALSSLCCLALPA